MAGSTSSNRREPALKRAAALITEALDLLDGNGGPADAAAHLDLALERVREALKRET
jgi:hypothetical protein